MNASAPRSTRRLRPGLGVEVMERRALLATATAPVISVAPEVAVLKGNITTIEQATTALIARANADIKYRQSDEAANKGNAAQDKADIAYDKGLIKDAGRDEKFAIGQQNGIILSLQYSQIQYNKMKTPNNTALEGDIVGANVKATADLNALLGTFAANKA